MTNADQFSAARWFSGARLNFAENLLRNRSNKTALVARLEDGSRRVMSYAQLYEQVAQLPQRCAAPGLSVGIGGRVYTQCPRSGCRHVGVQQHRRYLVVLFARFWY